MIKRLTEKEFKSFSCGEGNCKYAPPESSNALLDALKGEQNEHESCQVGKNAVSKATDTRPPVKTEKIENCGRGM